MTALALVVVVSPVGAAHVPDPADTVTVVYPSGEYPDDVETVQAAVDGGGTVLLKSVNIDGEPTAFNFGPPDVRGRERLADVLLTVDVAVIGDDGPMAPRIEGGGIPFFGVESTRTRVEGITFDGPLLSAMIFVRSAGAEIVGNHVTGVVGLLLSFGITEGRGVKFLGNSDPTNAITGHIRIADNRFGDMDADLSEAIVFDSVAADVTVVGNHVEDVGSGGVLAIVPGGDVDISHNTIIPGPGDGDELPFGNGVQLLGSAGGTYRVVRNVIHCENPLADTILIAGQVSELGLGAVNAPVVTQNDLTHAGTDFGAITLFGDVSDGSVANNRIAGSGLYALGVLPLFPGETATGNRFRGNNLTGFDAALADTIIFSHATNTHVVGNAGTVFDIGSATVITGEQPVKGNLSRGHGGHDAVRVAVETRPDPRSEFSN